MSKKENIVNDKVFEAELVGDDEIAEISNAEIMESFTQIGIDMNSMYEMMNDGFRNVEKRVVNIEKTLDLISKAFDAIYTLIKEKQGEKKWKEEAKECLESEQPSPLSGSQVTSEKKS